MEKHIIYQRIAGSLEDIAKLNNLLYAMSSTDIQRYADNYEVLAIEAALRAEKIACRQRHLIFQGTRVQKRDYLESAADALDISVASDEGVVYISIPGLMPKRKQNASTEFLLDPLYYAMGHFMDSQKRLPRYEECVVHFTQVYDRSLPSRRIRDFDNLELKQVLDIITAFVMVDDGGLLCEVHHCSQLGDTDKTLISVMEKRTFPWWLLAQKQGKRMSDLCLEFEGVNPTSHEDDN